MLPHLLFSRLTIPLKATSEHDKKTALTLRCHVKLRGVSDFVDFLHLRIPPHNPLNGQFHDIFDPGFINYWSPYSYAEQFWFRFDGLDLGRSFSSCMYLLFDFRASFSSCMYAIPVVRLESVLL